MGGAERVMSELANSWSEMGYEVYLLLLVRRPNFYKINPEVTIFELDNKKRDVGREITIFYRLRKKLLAIKPSFVLSFMTKYNCFTILASIGLKIPVFVSDRSNPLKRLSGWVVQLRKQTYPYAAGVLAQTGTARDFLLKNIRLNNVAVIPNPLRDQDFSENITKENIILSVGRLVPEKGHNYLLDAFTEIDRKGWRLVILGGGELKDSLRVQAEELGISNELYMPGPVKNVDKWLQRAEIFAFTSISEGFPNALSEAMGAGMACVSFDCNAGPADLIMDGQNGFLIDTGDTEKLRERLEELMNSESLRKNIGQKAQESSLKLKKKLVTERILDFCQKTPYNG